MCIIKSYFSTVTILCDYSRLVTSPRATPLLKARCMSLEVCVYNKHRTSLSSQHLSQSICIQPRWHTFSREAFTSYAARHIYQTREQSNDRCIYCEGFGSTCAQCRKLHCGPSIQIPQSYNGNLGTEQQSGRPLADRINHFI